MSEGGVPMTRRLLSGLLLAALFFAVASAVGARNLRDNEYYREARRYELMAERALENGEYDKAIEYSQEAERLSKLAVEYADGLLLFYQANGLLRQARDRMRYADWIGANKRYPDRYSEASDAFDEAQQRFDADEYEASIESSRAVLAALEDIAPRVANPFPEYYVVRLIPERRDCFWRIAEYSFIYNDARKWPLIYEANKHLLVNPENEDLIHPGQRFRIPSLRGEERSGTYDPDGEYPALARE
jgi:nucleoid-associated protein YgaU